MLSQTVHIIECAQSNTCYSTDIDQHVVLGNLIWNMFNGSWEYLYPSYGYHHIYCTLGWSNFHLFFDFRKRAHCYWLAIFLQKNCEFSTCAQQQIFYFKKITRDLEKKYFFGEICRNLLHLAWKNNWQNKIQT